MAHFRRYRRLSLVPLLFWLLMQFATGAAYAEHAPGRDPSASSSNFNAIICTPGGFLLVKLDSDGKRLPDHSDFYPGCQWCQPFGALPVLEAPEQPTLQPPAMAGHNYRLTADQVAGQAQRTSGSLSRAPPSLSFT